MLRTDITRSNMVIPKPIQWKQITLLEDWILEGIVILKSQIPEVQVLNTHTRDITQYQDRKVKISFDRISTSSRLFDHSSESIDLGRISQIPSVINLPYRSI